MMRLSKQNACNVIGLNQAIEASELKAFCRAALNRYCSGEGLAQKLMTQLMVQAYRVLAQAPASLQPATDPGYGERLSEALYWVTEQQLSFELCGVWLWVFDRSGQFQEVLSRLGFQWASKKGCWFLQPTVAPKPKSQVATDEFWDFKRSRATYAS